MKTVRLNEVECTKIRALINAQVKRADEILSDKLKEEFWDNAIREVKTLESIRQKLLAESDR